MSKYTINIVDNDIRYGRVYMESDIAKVYVIPYVYLRRCFTAPFLRQEGYFFYEDSNGVINLDYADEYYTDARSNRYKTIFVPSLTNPSEFIEHFIEGIATESGRIIDEMMSIYMSMRNASLINYELSDAVYNSYHPDAVSEGDTEPVTSEDGMPNINTPSENFVESEAFMDATVPNYFEERVQMGTEFAGDTNEADNATETAPEHVVKPSLTFDVDYDEEWVDCTTAWENIEGTAWEDIEETAQEDVEETAQEDAEETVQEDVEETTQEDVEDTTQEEALVDDIACEAVDDTQATQHVEDSFPTFDTATSYTELKFSLPSLDTDMLDDLAVSQEQDVEKEVPLWFDTNDEMELEFGDESFEDIYQSLHDENSENGSSEPLKPEKSDFIKGLQIVSQFVPSDKDKVVEPTVEESTSFEAPTFYLTVNNQYAEGYPREDGRFVLAKGSSVRPEMNPSCPENIRKLREFLADKIDSDNLTTDDIIFDNDFQAGSFVAGGNIGSVTGWHHCNGQTYKEFMRGSATPDTTVLSEEDIFSYTNAKKGIDAKLYYDKKTDAYWVLKGSRIASDIQLVSNSHLEKIRKVHKYAIDSNGVLTMSVRFTNVTTATNFVNGNTTGSTMVWKDKAGRKLAFVHG